MLKKIREIIYYSSPKLEGFPGIVHAFLGRTGGVSTGHLASLNLGRREEDRPENISENKKRIADAFEIVPERLFTVNQIHSDRIVVIDHAETIPEGIRALEADGIITDVRGVTLGMLTADCVPVLLFDCKKGVIAAIHAGWKGTASKIAVKAVDIMVERFECRPHEITAAIGPAIGSCCYEVGEEVVAAVKYRGKASIHRDGKWYLDLSKANLLQLKVAGVTDIDVSNLCTSCRTDLFFSHRGEKGMTGRQLSFITFL